LIGHKPLLKFESFWTNHPKASILSPKFIPPPTIHISPHLLPKWQEVTILLYLGCGVTVGDQWRSMEGPWRTMDWVEHGFQLDRIRSLISGSNWWLPLPHCSFCCGTCIY
jgi:hypothetical protein